MTSLAKCIEKHAPEYRQEDITATLRDAQESHLSDKLPGVEARLQAVRGVIAEYNDEKGKILAQVRAALPRDTEEAKSPAAAPAKEEVAELKPAETPAAETATASDTPQAPATEKDVDNGLVSAVVDMAEFFYTKIIDGGMNFKNISQARKEVADRFNVPTEERERGEFLKAVDEAIEFAVSMASWNIVRAGAQEGVTEAQIFNQLVELYKAQPRLGVRTSDSVRNQAYSTPAPIAFLANQFTYLHRRPTATVYEPTAGTGMLLISANPEYVTANEMNKLRHALLKERGVAVARNEDAMDVDLQTKVDVVMANPPFGKVKNEDGTDKTFTVDGFETTEIDQAISLQALAQMHEKGQAVLIIGGLNKQTPDDERAKKYGAGAKRRFFEHLYGKYKVLDHFTVAGELYEKQGAGWPIDVIYISGKGQSTKATPDFVAPPIYRSFEELGERLNEIQTGEKTAFGVDATRRQQEAANIVRGPRSTSAGHSYRPLRPDNGPTTQQAVPPAQEVAGGVPGGEGRPGGETGGAGPAAIRGDAGAVGLGLRESGDGRGDNDALADQPAEGGKGADGDPRGEGAVRGADAGRVDERPGRGNEREVIASQGQTHYTPTSAGEKIGTLTPQNMAASIQRALARVAEKHGSVDEFVMGALQYDSMEALHKAFSAEQVDAIALALDNLQKGQGMIIGDQTGIGKGRIVAAMIRYAVKNDKVPVFVTEKQALYADMYRDLTDIGFGPEVVADIMQTNGDAVEFDADAGVILKSPGGWSKTLGDTKGMPVDHKTKREKKIVFTTYDQLNTQFEKRGTDKMAPRRRFIDQLMSSKQVVLIMDESHNAGGSGDLENLRPDPKTGIIPHPRALFFRQIIPRADGVIYSSATYAKNPDVMDLYSATDLKLGVGGDIKALAETVTQGGIPFQQITAAMLSESGQYIRRERSFDGVTYTPKVYDVDTKAAESVSAAMAAIREFEDTFISPVFEVDPDAKGSNALGAAGEQAQNFTSLMHNVISQMLLSLKVRPAVKDAIAVLDKGQSKNEQVILTVANTMGSFIAQYAKDFKLIPGDEVQLKFNDLLQRYLYKTREYTTDERDEKGDKVRFFLSDDELGDAGVAAYQRVQDMIDSLDLSSMPVSPVDYMLNELAKAGYPALEITGRDFMIDYSGRIPVLAMRDPKEKSVNGRNATIRKFNAGKNRAIILNRSGSTGISLHASIKNPEKGRGKRTMIVVQAEQDINVHMQMLGRPHRTGQVVVPAFIQAVANVPAEKKQAAMLVQKMAGLNANTTADADSLLTDKSTVNFLNKYGDLICARTMKQNPLLNARLGAPYHAGEDGKDGSYEGLAKKVTGRLPLLPMKEQEEVYRAIEEAYADFIAELDAMGRNDLEAKTFDLDARTVEKRDVLQKKGESPFEGAVFAERVDMKRIGKPFTTDEVLSLVETHKGEGEQEAKEALAAFEAYRSSAIQEYMRKADEAATEVERDATMALMQTASEKLESDRQRFVHMNDFLSVGTPLHVDLNMGLEDAEKLVGIVIGKVKRGNPKNPIAMGSWRVKVAVADGIRVINLPFSRISLSAIDDKNSVILTRVMTDMKGAARAFDAALTLSREERWIITGNLFSGFSTFRDGNGQIINFTRDDGTVQQGVLMPRKFDPQAALDKTPVAFESFSQVRSFFDKTDGFIKLRGPGDLRIVHTKGNYVISTEKSTSRGGRYFRDDRQLLSIVEGFFSRGDRMTTGALDEKTVKEVFDLFKGRGNTWFTDKMLDEARAAVGGVRESNTTSTGRPANVRAELEEKLGVEQVAALIKSGLLEIVDRGQADETRHSERTVTQGLTTSEGKVRLFQGAIPEGHAWAVLKHELGNHARYLLADNAEYRRILQSLEARKEEGSATGEAIRAAMARVPKKTRAEHYWEEVLAYMIEQSPETTIVRRVLAIIKKILVKVGVSPDIFNDKDFAALAEIAVRVTAMEAQRGVYAAQKTDTGREGSGYSADSPRSSERDQGTTGRDDDDWEAGETGRVLRGLYDRRTADPAVEAQKPKFKKWFGDSKITDNRGVPVILYHGTSDPNFLSNPDYEWVFDTSRPVRRESSPLAPLGAFFGSETIANAHSVGTPGTTHAFFIRVENPYYAESKKLERIVVDHEAARALRNRLILDGYDGIVITDRAQAIIFDKNQAKSAEQNNGEYSLDNDDVRYSERAADDPADPLSTQAIQEVAGSIRVLRAKKKDSTFLDRIFSTPEYYFKKFAAAGRVLRAALNRRDLKYRKEQEILKDFATYIQGIKKKNPSAYKEANSYLLEVDQSTEGYRIVSSGDKSWKVLAPRSTVPGVYTKEKATIAEFTAESDDLDAILAAEKKAVDAMIAAEGEGLRKEGYSEEAIDAVRRARELTNRGFDVMAADMRRIIREAAENGQPNPFVGDGKLDEAGRYAVYAEGKDRPIALFASEREATEFLGQAAKMISYMVFSQKHGEKTFMTELKANEWARRHSGKVKGVPAFQNLRVKRRTDAEMRPLTVRQALAQMGDLRGIYFPRIREAGEYVLIAKKAGANPIRKHFDIPTVGDDKPTLQAVLNWATPIGREAKKLKAQGYAITIKRDDSPAEEVFEATNLISSLDAIMQSSMSVVDKNNSVEIAAGQHINQILTMQIADIFKQRGYLSSRMKRLAGDEVWEGYEEDMAKALVQYGKNVASGTAKRDTARAMILAFTGRDYSWAEYKAEVDKPDWAEYMKIVEERRIDERTQKNLFRDVRNFMIDILRNDEQADRIIGTLKGLAVLKYLGFRVSSAAINMTNMVQGVPATLAGHTGESVPEALGRVISAATAYGKYRSGKASADDKRIFEYISAHGWDEAQFNYEAASVLRSKVGETWNKFMTASMFMFGAAEKTNRATTLYAAYKAIREKEATADESVVWEKAKEISDRAHGIYGKETLPSWARGKYNVLRLTYTFQKFSHNYMLNLIDLGLNKKEYQAAAWMLLSPALLAGSGATLAAPVLFAAAGALGLGGDDPEEAWYTWAEETFGGGAFARHGLFGMAGINVKGSLAIGLPTPADIQNMKVVDALGPVGGIVNDTTKGIGHILKGQVAKGAEALLPTAFGSAIKASREASEGITTSNYGTVFYGDEPLKADATDAFLRFFSFNPSRISGIREKQWNEKEVAQRYQDEKSAIYSKIKQLYLNGEKISPELLKTIKAYNDRVVASGRRDIKPITPSGIHEMLKRNNRPSKIEQSRRL